MLFLHLNRRISCVKDKIRHIALPSKRTASYGLQVAIVNLRAKGIG